MAKSRKTTERVHMINKAGEIKPFTRAYSESDEAKRGGWKLHETKAEKKADTDKK